MEKNVNLLRTTLALIKINPEHHSQENWRCETGMCFAGWAGIIGGAEWANPDDPDDATVVFINDDGKQVFEHVSDYAKHALGLDWDDADRLFESSNSIDDLERMVDNLCNGDPITS